MYTDMLSDLDCALAQESDLKPKGNKMSSPG